jgi:hypothetical protein
LLQSARKNCPRRFPPPRTVIEHTESFWVQDASGQTVGWFYFRDNPETARHAGVLKRDESRRMAVNFARLPDLLGKGDSGSRGQPGDAAAPGREMVAPRYQLCRMGVRTRGLDVVPKTRFRTGLPTVRHQFWNRH